MLTQLRRVLIVLALPLIAGLVATAYAYHEQEPQAPQGPSEAASETAP